MTPVAGKDKEHVAEKPAGVLNKLIGLTPAGATVLDPFAGSGVTLACCVDLKRSYIGIEIDEVYCGRATARVMEARTKYKLFNGQGKDDSRLEQLDGMGGGSVGDVGDCRRGPE